MTARLLFAVSAATLLSGCVGLFGPTVPPRAEPTAASNGRSLREVVEPALATIDRHPDVFGGGYVASDGSALHVLYVGPKEGAQDALVDVLPSGVPVVWTQVHRSYAELERIRSELVDYWNRGARDRISDVALDIATNSVRVSTPQPAPDLTAELHSRYGGAVTFTIAAPDEPA